MPRFFDRRGGLGSLVVLTGAGVMLACGSWLGVAMGQAPAQPASSSPEPPVVVKPVPRVVVPPKPGVQPHNHNDDPVEFTEPRTFAAAMQQAKQRLAGIRASIDGQKLMSIHGDAYVLAKLGFRFGELARASKLNVPDDDLKQIFLGARKFAKLADDLHELADAGDLNGAGKGFQALLDQFALIESKVPATFACPMRCEESKTYAAPGTCPVCQMNLKKITTDRYDVEVWPVATSLVAGKEAELWFEIKDPLGGPVKEFEVVHEKKLHLLMVSKDLSWFAHEHPVLQSEGTFTLNWAFPRPGEYTLFSDFTPPDVGMQVVPFTLTIPGAAAAPVELRVDADQPKVVDGYSVTLDTGGAVTIGGSTTLAYTIARLADPKDLRSARTPVTDLEPYLGAMGHLIIVSQDRGQFVHSHPHEKASESAATSGVSASGEKGPRIEFAARFVVPGRYKAWAQFQHKGKVLTVPFVFEVTVPKR